MIEDEIVQLRIAALLRGAFQIFNALQLLIECTVPAFFKLLASQELVVFDACI